jgi:hypothetical protein
LRTLLATLRGKPSRSRNSTTAPMAAAFRSAWGPSDLSDRARRPAPSIARARQMLPANTLRVLTHMTSWSCRVGCWPQGRRGQLFPRCVVEAEIRNSSRPGSQAPHAPPALTFGLPGKQKVNEVQAGRDLHRVLRTLLDNRNIFINGTGRPFQQARSRATFLKIGLSLRVLCRQRDLTVQEIGEFYSLGLERLRIERGLGQARQRVGFEKDRPLLRHDEIRTGIAAA